MENRKQFTFYASFHEAAQALQSTEERGALYGAICDYALYGIEPQISGMAAAMFALIRPNLDASRRKAENRLGKKQTDNKPKTNQHQTEKKIEVESKKKKESKYEYEYECEKENEYYILGGAGGEISPADKPPRSRFVPPDETQAIAFFRENGSNKTEAQTFLDYYQANGWKISGKTPMKDWQAAARNWIRRAGQYSKPQATQQPQQKTARGVLSDAVDMIENGDFSFMEV